jgi:hypothetical protein
VGEAKRRRAAGVPTIYHHTSTLRTHLIWMSGVIELEGKSPPVQHPHIGEIRTDALARRAVIDFPRLAWFTTQISIPNCLINSVIYGIDKLTGERKAIETDAMTANALALNRVAIGFPIDNVPVVPWPEHAGYSTGEGRELNETAIEMGDNPKHWYVAEEPVKVLQASEIWSSPSMLIPRLIRQDWYLRDVHRMVRLCREKRVYIPPTWLKPEDARALARKLNVPLGTLD